MKNLIMLCLLLSSIGLSAQKAVIDLASTIEQVTVFLEGAQIYRTAELPLSEGVSEIKLSGLSASVDPASIRVQLPDDVLLLSVQYQLDYLREEEPLTEQKRLTDTLQQLTDSIAILHTVVKSVSEELVFLRGNHKLGSQQVGVQFENYKKMHAYYAEQLRKLELLLFTHQRRIKVLQREQLRIRNQLKVQQKPAETFGELHLKLKAEKRRQTTVDISYYTRGASWKASYDLRVTDVESPMELTYQANVFQNTGVDWKDVMLTFSNANPLLSGQLPELNPIRLGQRSTGRASSKPPVRRERFTQGLSSIEGMLTDAETGEGLINATVLVRQNGVQVGGVVTDFDGNYYMRLDPGEYEVEFSYTGYNKQVFEGVTIWGQQSANLDLAMHAGAVLDEVVITAYSKPLVDAGSFGSGEMKSSADISSTSGRSSGLSSSSARRNKSYKKRKPEAIDIPSTLTRRPTTVEMSLDVPFSVPSDRKTYTVDVRKYKVPANYVYNSVPKLREDAFLTARITDWEELYLIEGMAKLYFENTYVGKSKIQPEAAGDTLSLSLGSDKGVQVERKRIKAYSRKNFFGNRIAETIGHEIRIRNAKSQSIQLIITDQVPISTLKEIEVNRDEVSGAAYNKDKGELRWSITLAPGEEKVLVNRYTVKYPKEMRLVLD